MNLQEILFKELSENGILNDVLEEIVEKKIVKTVHVDKSEPISKEKIIEYLKESGLHLTQKNFEQASYYLQSKQQSMNEDGDIEITSIEKEYVNHLNEFSESDMKTLIDICILRMLEKTENELLHIIEQYETQQFYEYQVEIVEDISGSTNTSKLRKILNQYAEEGYRVKNIFTNEIGKNEFRINGIGTNSTIDQVIIIFERAIR